MPENELIRRQLLLATRTQRENATSTPVNAGSQVPQGVVQRALANPHALQSSDMLYLQRTIGNRALNQLLSNRSSRLTVGASGDHFEQEADRISQQVSGPGQSSSVQRSANEAEVGVEGGAISHDLESRIQRAKGGGSPAPEGVRRAMEERTGSDLSNVRVHNNKEANSISSELGAKAATYGKDIFLARDQSPHDVQLMAHELTHTVQQGAVKAAGEHTAVQNSGTKTPAIQLKKNKFDKWVNRNKNPISSEEHRLKRVEQLRELTDEQLKKGQISKTIGYHALRVFQELLLLPVTIIDQLTVLDLHLKDFSNFLRSGKTRDKNTKRRLKTQKRLRKSHYKQEIKRVKKLKGNNYTAKDFKQFNPMVTSTHEKIGTYKRIMGRSGLRGYITGQHPHKFMYGGKHNIAQKGLLNSEFNPLKHVVWGVNDLIRERGLHKKERTRRAGQALLQNGNDNVQDDNEQTVNGQVDDLNIVQHEDGTGLTSEVGGDIDQGSDAGLEFIGNLFEVEEEIDKKTEENQTNDG